ncbi:MAG: sodium-dependent transporter [Desulfovermiculus sp.]|nr:sodium-dependent transporter [Desulfovermiculus sp.]
MAQREQWGTRAGFIMAAVGSAIGLGNIWRFPYMAYDNGGGAFLIPYFFALLTAGIPIIIMEFGLGHKFKGSAPMSFAKAKQKWEWLGWWQVFVSFVISIYYVVVIAWALNYTLLATNLGWGEDTKAFFFNDFLQLSSSPMEWGSIVWPVFVAAVVIWFITWLVLFSGVKRGIELANKIFMPLLFLLLLIMLGRAVTLDGAAEGLQWLFRPDFSAILDYQVWTAAYGQIFFTLSICFAIMITYSSYLPEKSDINNNGMMTAFINCGFSMLSGIMIFAVLGYMATQQGVDIQDVAGAGVGLAFITIPKAISLLPGASFFGFLFFLALVFAGLSSMISITEACCSGLMDKFGWGRKPTTSLFCIIGFMFSLVFMTQAGLLVLDIVDHFINNFGIVFAGLVEVILLSWFFKLDSIREHANSLSDFRIGTWWNFCLKVITPIVLGYMAIANLVGDIRSAYGGYPGSALLIFGWVIVIGIVVLSFVMQSGRSCANDT